MQARSPRRASPKARSCPLRSNRSCLCCRRIVPPRSSSGRPRDCSLTRSDQRSTIKSCGAAASPREIVGWGETMAAAGSSGRNGETPPVLVAEALVKRFGGVAAVDGVSLSVGAGEIVGLIGPNGAGKTTLFDCLAGEQKPSSGRVLINGRAVESAAPDARLKDGLGRTFQIPRPFPGMTLIENVMLGAQGQSGERLWPNWLMPARVAREERAIFARAMELLKFVTLDDLARRPARVLSGGQRKLLEIARALMAQPKLLLLDEPAAGVNPLLLNVIVERMIEINRQRRRDPRHRAQHGRDRAPVRAGVRHGGRETAERRPAERGHTRSARHRRLSRRRGMTGPHAFGREAWSPAMNRVCRSSTAPRSMRGKARLSPCLVRTAQANRRFSRRSPV